MRRAAADDGARLLRAAVSEGVLDTDGDGRFDLNDFSRPLRADVEGSVRDMVLGWSALRTGYVAFAHLDDAVRTGTSGTELAFGVPFHDYMRTDNEQAALYETAMESTVDGFVAAVEAYDYSRFRRVVDLGGGQGSFLVALLQRYPDLEVTLFDLPDVVAGAPARLAPYPERDRISIVAGDLFADIPPSSTPTRCQPCCAASTTTAASPSCAPAASGWRPVGTCWRSRW